MPIPAPRHFPVAVAAAAWFSSALTAQVAGTVVDAATQQPIADAIVTLQATKSRTTTDGAGGYALPVTGSNLTVVAAKKGYFNASVTVTAPASGVTIALTRVQVGANASYQLIDPQTCAMCHPDQFVEWENSPMQRAGTNTWVYDTYDGSGTTGGLGGFVYLRDSALAASHPDSECASCHQPEPWVAQPFRALEPIGQLSLGAMHGVSCEVCHKIADVDEQKMNYPGLYPGAMTFNRPNAPLSINQVVYGALGDANFHTTGLMRPSFQPQLVAQVCGTCHQDKNDPDDDGNFEEPDGVVSEPTYHEWRDSPYGDPDSGRYRSCVDCHMPPSGATEACTMQPVTRPPGAIRSHRIEGTTPQFLDNAVDLRLEVRQASTAVTVVVDVDNRHTGHHVPTGVTIRNMILLVEAWRVADGQRLQQVAGPRLHPLAGVGAPDQGYYAGLPGKLYAKINHDPNGNSPTFFTDAAGIVADTRIPALANDVTRYRFAAQPGDEVTVRARLIYRRSWRALVDAKQWTTDGHGQPLADIAPPYYGHLMEEAQWSTAGPGPVAGYGVGCEGLGASWASMPQTGHPFAATLSGATPNTLAVFWLGLSATTWNGLPLPLDLTPLGAPACSVLAAMDLVYPAVTDGSGQAVLPLSFPHPGPIGLLVHGQWGAGSPNAFGWALSDGLRITFQR